MWKNIDTTQILDKKNTKPHISATLAKKKLKKFQSKVFLVKSRGRVQEGAKESPKPERQMVGGGTLSLTVTESLPCLQNDAAAPGTVIG